MELALAMLAAFIVKHFVCDFPVQIQTPWMFLNKGTYGHLGGIAHVLIHLYASFMVLLAFSCVYAGNYLFLGIVGLLFIEGMVHYHMDWFKMWWGKRNGYMPNRPQFWFWFGIDQMVHYLTYIVMVLLWT